MMNEALREYLSQSRTPITEQVLRNVLRQEMGLGQAQTIVRVEIFWPCTGKTQVLTGLEMDRFYRVKERQAEAMPWNLKSFRLDSKAGEIHGHHHHS